MTAHQHIFQYKPFEDYIARGECACGAVNFSVTQWPGSDDYYGTGGGKTSASAARDKLLSRLKVLNKGNGGPTVAVAVQETHTEQPGDGDSPLAATIEMLQSPDVQERIEGNVSTLPPYSRARVQHPRVDRQKCEECGKDFYCPPSRLAQGRGHYCKKCYNKKFPPPKPVWKDGERMKDAAGTTREEQTMPIDVGEISREAVDRLAPHNDPDVIAQVKDALDGPTKLTEQTPTLGPPKRGKGVFNSDIKAWYEKNRDAIVAEAQADGIMAAFTRWRIPPSRWGRLNTMWDLHLPLPPFQRRPKVAAASHGRTGPTVRHAYFEAHKAEIISGIQEKGETATRLEWNISTNAWSHLRKEWASAWPVFSKAAKKLVKAKQTDSHKDSDIDDVHAMMLADLDKLGMSEMKKKWRLDSAAFWRLVTRWRPDYPGIPAWARPPGHNGQENGSKNIRENIPSEQILEEQLAQLRNEYEGYRRAVLDILGHFGDNGARRQFEIHGTAK